MGFVEELKLSIGIEGVEKFKNTIFGPYLNIPNCNYQGQITKCLLLLELEQDNIDELHIRHVSGNILHFTIKEFAIITSLKCIGNANEFKYPDSTHSRLIQRYFPDSQNVVKKGRLVQRFRMGQ
uniref:Ulp1 protease family, C-terminal catalytic domain containing protein n=1 Tax=Solanum tuberosum TaxID=4113 RepID=M1BBI8_SOLTU